MRRLFLKTFLWFWLTVILAIVAALGPAYYATYKFQSEWRARAPAILQTASREAVDTYERSGNDALAEYLGKLEREHSVLGYLYWDDQEILDPRVGPEPEHHRMAQVAEQQDGPYIRSLQAAQRVTGASGKTYALVLAYRGGPEMRYWPAIEIPMVLLAAGGLFCYLITRHITAPLFKLRTAAAAIAEGRLDTRVGPALGYRSDEIADLASDFDYMAERIESLLAGQKRLLGDVSHELRSPLARLTVALSMAKEGPPAEAPEHLERIQLETKRLDVLIGQLLTLSRIDSGVHSSERASLDLCGLIQEIASDADFEARARSCRVSLEHTDACTIMGSEEILRSAIENVLRNAVRHTREGTAVEVGLRRNASKAVLHVRDHGPGVSESMLLEMFLPFRRAPEMNSNGAGLGLAITERAIRAHGGTVRAENASGGGLTVEIELPLT